MYNRILLVDDDLVSSLLNREMLSRFGLKNQTYSMRNGKDALKFILENRSLGNAFPDLLLLDINMPVMGAFEFLAKFQRLPSNIRDSIQIIILTSSNNPDDLERAHAFPIKAYLTKPLTAENLSTIFIGSAEKVITKSLPGSL
jgi:CheY-like chemotaxis protein